jgi:hypothetical protein
MNSKGSLNESDSAETANAGMESMDEIAGWLRELHRLGGRPAIIAFTGEGRQMWSFERLGHSIEGVAAGLSKVGFCAGRRGVLFAKGSPE